MSNLYGGRAYVEIYRPSHTSDASSVVPAANSSYSEIIFLQPIFFTNATARAYPGGRLSRLKSIGSVCQISWYVWYNMAYKRIWFVWPVLQLRILLLLTSSRDYCLSQERYVVAHVSLSQLIFLSDHCSLFRFQIGIINGADFGERPRPKIKHSRLRSGTRFGNLGEFIKYLMLIIRFLPDSFTALHYISNFVLSGIVLTSFLKTST